MYNINSIGSSVNGFVYLRGYTGTSPVNHLLVFASNDNVNWFTILDTNFYTYGSGGVTTINCGQVNSNFKYLSIVVFNDTNNKGDVYLDSVYVF